MVPERREPDNVTDVQAEPDLTPVFYDWTLNFEHETPRAGFAYWNLCRAKRVMPALGDLTPRGMKAFIANAALFNMQPLAAGAVDYVVRLTGERVRERYGAVARRKLSEFLPPHLEQRWRYALELVRVSQAPLRVHGRMSYDDQTWLYQETLLAPLSGADGQLRAFLTVTAWWTYRGARGAGLEK